MIQATVLDYIVIVSYFLIVLAFGAYFVKYTKSTKDFFFGGQRFSWWLIAMSCVATVVGSYSFIKYSTAGFKYGLSSSMTYLNDWLILPFFVLGWFPIIYFRRVVSIPEYFEKRFDRKTRIAALVFIMVYMVGYVGINFYTIGVALQPLLNINIYAIIGFVAVISAVYMHAGGQTSVIMTDLLQGFLLLLAGFALFFLGLDFVGGWDKFLAGLPMSFKQPLAGFNSPPKFNFVGIFWQDAVANSIAFYFMNQGVLMRFMSAKSPRDGYRAIFAVVLILMPLAAVAGANAGWLGRSFVTNGLLDADTNATNIFVTVASLITKPGIFGLILAALTAALMSTIDTLITAISAVFVNDIWKPFIVKDREDKYYLKVAKWTAFSAAILGVCLVPIFEAEKSIYVAHGKFVATITPPMVIVILLSVFWKRFTAHAAFWTLIIGGAMTFFVAYYPTIAKPISHGVDVEGGLKFMRAFFGIIVSLITAIVLTFFSKPKSEKELEGLVIDSFQKAKEFFKGGKPNEVEGGKSKGHAEIREIEGLHISKSALAILKAEIGDIIYVTDARWWYGGLRSIHAKVTATHDGDADLVYMPQSLYDEGHFQHAPGLKLEKII